MLGCLDLVCILLVEVAHVADLQVAEERVVVEAELRVQGEQFTGAGHDERVHLEKRAVAGDEGGVERLEHLGRFPDLLPFET